MSFFNITDYTDFFTDYSIKSGELVTEGSINSGPLRLKKELDWVYNSLGILNGNDIIPWRAVEPYLAGELVQNYNVDNKYYRARKNNTNKRPDLFPDDWTEVTAADLTVIGDFTNYLAKDNNNPYTPTEDYNPATKKYIDDNLLNYMFISSSDTDLDYIVRRGTYLIKENTSNAPTSNKGNLLVIGNDSNYTQFFNDLSTNTIYYRYYNGSWGTWNTVASLLNDNNFTGTCTFANNIVQTETVQDSTITNLNATNTVLDNLTVDNNTIINGDLIVNGETTTINSTVVSVDDKTLELAAIDNPTDNTANGSGIIIKGTTNKSMLWDLNTDTFIFNKDITTNLIGNADTASKWENSRTFTFSGDVSGTASVDGSADVDISISVLNNSHTHDDRYYTKTESDNRFLRKDTDDTFDGNLLVTGDLTVNGEIQGTSNKAKYADLAEIYTAEKDIKVGTIVTIDENSKFEVSICSKDKVPFGVISDKPGYLLNYETEGVKVALIGKTPIRIKGPIKKGEPVTIMSNGIGKACNFETKSYFIIGRALESKSTEDEELVLCAVSIS